MAFEKVILRNGEVRADYIKRRLADGAKTHIIMAEINGEALYSGPEGKTWSEQVVQVERRKLKAKSAPATAASVIEPVAAARQAAKPEPIKAEPIKAEATILSKEDLAAAVVPPEYEGILTVEDIVEVREQAAIKIRAKQRKLAKESLLAQASAELEREAQAAMRRGAARGDMVDVNIDLAPYAACITLDGQQFYHGTMHRVARPVAKTLQEMMQRSWAHQDSISGQRKDFFQRDRFQANGRVHERDARTGGLRL